MTFLAPCANACGRMVAVTPRGPITTLCDRCLEQHEKRRDQDWEERVADEHDEDTDQPPPGMGGR